MKPGRKRILVDAVRSEWQVSIRRACAALEFGARPTTTGAFAPARPPSSRRSRRSAMFVSATVIVVFTSCCVVKAGVMGRTRPVASIANWAGNCTTKRPRAGSRPSCAMIAGRHTIERDLADGFVHDQLASGQSFDLRSSIPCPASRRRWRRDSPFAAPTSWRCWKGPARKWGSRQRPAWIKAASSGRVILSLPARRRARLLKPGKPTDNAFIERSTAASGPNASTRIVPVPCRRPGKSGDLAQIL